MQRCMCNEKWFLLYYGVQQESIRELVFDLVKSVVPVDF
jgi:hypothetical protein